jgi:hypothetical protein
MSGVSWNYLHGHGREIKIKNHRTTNPSSAVACYGGWKITNKTAFSSQILAVSGLESFLAMNPLFEAFLNGRERNIANC